MKSGARLLVFGVSSALVVGLAACDPKETGSEGPGEAGSGSSGSSSETGEPQGCQPPAPNGGPECEVDADCSLASDCCSCVGFNPSNSIPGSCGDSCEQGTCESWGVTEAQCLAGACVPRGVSCDQDTVTCNAIVPECPEGTLPGVADACYTDACIPASSCRWAPSCASCEADDVCMHETRFGCDYVRCVPVIPECNGPPVCGCTGGIFCEDGTCTETAEGFDCGPG